MSHKLILTLDSTDDILDRYLEVDELLSSSLPTDVLDTFSSRRRPSLSGNQGPPLVRESWSSVEHGYGGEGAGENEPLLKRENGVEEREKRKEKRESLMLNGESFVLFARLSPSFCSGSHSQH